MSMKVITYDVGTTGLKACLFSVSRDEGIAYITSTVEDYGLQVLGGARLNRIRTTGGKPWAAAHESFYRRPA